MARIDLDKLSEEFGINKKDLSDLEGKQEEELSTDFPDSKEAVVSDPDRILENNINKANTVLDRIISEMRSGNFSARMAEVAGQLVNAVTMAVDKVYAKNAGIDNLLVKRKMIDLKEKEADIRERIIGAKSKTREKLIITDRETIMNMIKDEKDKDVQLVTSGKEATNDNG